MTEYHSVRSFAREEPRIELIEATLRSLLGLVELEFEGTRVQVDGFRLRDPNQWRTVPATSLQLNLGSLSTACNCRCGFCYELGNPPGLFETEPRFVGLQEARTRRKYFHGGFGLATESKSSFEELTNPDFLDLMHLLREHDPGQLLEVTTNGALLTDDIVAKLAELKPIWINISLNSADPRVRGSIMDDRRSQRAVRVPQLLRARGIPFLGSIVPWPEQGLDDIDRTIEYLDAQEARMIRVAMPALTQYHPRHTPAALRAWLPAARERVAQVRRRVRTPVLVSPFAQVSSALDPIVEGVIRRSPAASAGIEVGDRILSVDGREVVSRAHASGLLEKTLPSGRVRLKIARRDSTFDVVLETPPPGQDLYPYQPSGYRRLDFPGMAFGICLPGSFHLSYVKRIYEEIVARKARRVLVLASAHFRELVSGLLADLPLPADTNLELLVPENRFYGGDVDIADLWVVEDVAASVREHSLRNGSYDLLVMPSSFLSRWGRDLLGVPYTELETALGLEVAVIHCERILL